MKRITVLCTAASRTETLDALQSAGVLHIDSDGAAPVEADALRKAQAELDKANRALAILSEAAKDDGEKAFASIAPSPKEVVEAYDSISAAEGEKRELERTIALYSPFGDFNPADVAALSADGLETQLFRARREDVPQAGDSTILREFSVADGNVYCAAIGRGPFDFGPAVEKIALPSESLSAMRKRLGSIESTIAGAKAKLRGWSAYVDAVRSIRDDRSAVCDYLSAAGAMGSDEGILWLSGYTPAENVADVKALAAEHGWGIVERDPLPDEEPPTVMRPPRIFRPISALFAMLGISPKYREGDLSIAFYAFFTIFFAMIVGDAGYGAVMLVGTLLARRKFRKAPSAPFTLLTVFSIATIAWGWLNATYFGIAQDALPAIMRPKTAAWLGNQSNIMQLCFVLGAVHLTIARVWNAIMLAPSTKALAELGWIGIVWTMYCVACMVVVTGFVFPPYMLYVAAVSALMIACFMLTKKELKTQGVSLAMLPLNIISSLGDIISYVRLFAVGLSSVKVAENFNQMALGLQLPLWAKIPCVVLILLVGHGLNFAMGALSILVHAVRLNTLEFSNHKGVTWTGYEYRPFGRKSA